MQNVEGNKAFLGVEESALGQKWIERLSPAGRNDALAISQQMDLPELLGRVLAGRNVSPDGAAAFLDPKLRDLMPDPVVLTGMHEATSRLAKAINGGERIAIFGDYDVDGAASSALMYKFLECHGIKARIYIPDRIFEGYGPNPEAIQTLAKEGAELIVTVDCGATSFEALEEAHRLGVDVVVLDHHQMGVDLPTCVALVNPNRQDDLSDLGYLCAAGVVFLTLVSLARFLREEGFYKAGTNEPDLISWLDLVALATVCDVVPLRSLNRAFVVKGLQVMAMQRNTGLKALMRISRLDGPPRPYHLGFVLGPRINAGGRIGDAAKGARLLTSNDQQEASDIAEELDALNAERQRAEVAMLEEAISEAERDFGDGTSVIVTASDTWHPGIVGLLASRLKERFRRPSLAIAFDRNGKGSGSGRSISGVDLGAAVRAAVDEQILVKGGGHAMAAGLTVERQRLGDLRGFLEEFLAASVGKASSVREVRIDGALTSRSASLELVDLLEKAGPFGQENPQPVFAFPAHRVQFPKVVGKDHVSFVLQAGDGSKLRGISFRSADTELGRLLLNSRDKQIHVAGTLSNDFWQGSRRVQLRVVDAAVAN